MMLSAEQGRIMRHLHFILPGHRARSRNASREPGASVSDTEGSGVFKRVTTQFRRRMSGALPQHSSTQNRQSSYGPPMPSDFTNKEQREQALRERGLIPASRRDLSALEASRDLHKTYVKPLSDEEAGRGGKTAAMLIREQYEARERQLAQGQQSRAT
ncbi:hypothetical protein OE88DRAFT_293269 [Heliocybe sulcata]|uniref:Uncharacterized protein n=1 Tax=Heliocybe sulcata TaxID=5364 RepID=A0A5C3N1J5_9AGAM|nr:hypothetical protein OE88DRAFT_293269 [Heliocybe sulcata]